MVMRHLTTILLWLFACNALSQPVKEKVILFPDRNLYISGEHIQFSALIRPEGDRAAVSRILYCELITPRGIRMTGGKYASNNSIVNGHLAIPTDLITGIYYLKAYTKSMRNEGPSFYSYDFIKVVNPYRSEVNAGTNEELTVEGNADMIPDTMISNNIRVTGQALPGETVTVTIDDSSICRTLENLTISVIPEYALVDRIISTPDDTLNIDNYNLPETQGMLITGIVKDLSGNAIAGIRVNLSITGEERDFMSATTGKDGRFVFSPPDYTGDHDIFLCTENTDSLDTQILVDNDFCNLPVSMPEENFDLSDPERVTALNMAVRYNLEKYFNYDSLEHEGAISDETPVFYGEPDEILVIDEYVQLPTLEEYFNQLPVSVKIRKRSGQKYFKVLGTQLELMDIDPLVMVDLVVIDDPEKILALDPQKLVRIDIVNSLYVKGDRIYGGIVSLISREGDFAGISLPLSGVFINYSFLSNTGVTPAKTGKIIDVPDTRNTVFWRTVTNPDECTEISFSAPATPGRYLVVIRGINEKNDEVSSIWYLTVSF